MSARLSPRRRKFASEYVKNGFNGVQAVFAAGYKQGYESACVEASRLLRNAKVKSLVEQTLQKSQLTAESVSAEIAKVAFTDVPIDTQAKMKGLDLASKVLGMQTQKIETADVTEKDPATLLMLAINSQPGMKPVSLEHCQQLIKSEQERKLKLVNG